MRAQYYRHYRLQKETTFNSKLYYGIFCWKYWLNVRDCRTVQLSKCGMFSPVSLAFLVILMGFLHQEHRAPVPNFCFFQTDKVPHDYKRKQVLFHLIAGVKTKETQHELQVKCKTSTLKHSMALQIMI